MTGFLSASHAANVSSVNSFHLNRFFFCCAFQFTAYRLYMLSIFSFSMQITTLFSLLLLEDRVNSVGMHLVYAFQ